MDARPANRAIQIGSRQVGPGQPIFFVAELSGNHGGSFDRAMELVRTASEIGADAVKLQTFTPDTITLNSNRPDFQLDDTAWGEHKTFWDVYRASQTPWEWHGDLFDEARRLGLEVFSSPFDESAVDFLETLGSCAYKIASPEINHIPLLERVALTEKPVILSTGLATLSDIELAVEALRRAGCEQIAILKCTTAYPAPLAEINLRTMPDIARRFSVIPGLSDHTLGTVVATGAAALGACIIEKHITLEDGIDTIDSFFSLDPSEFQSLISDVRELEASLGEINYDVTESAQKNRKGMRSIYVSDAILEGSMTTRDNIKCVRPAFGVHPRHMQEVLGRRALRDLSPGEPLRFDDLA